jgi:hypothetical protein
MVLAARSASAQAVPRSASADAPPLTVTSAVDKSRITIGDLIEYTVTVSSQKGVKVEMPGLGANLGKFEIRDYRVEEPVQEGDRTISKYRYTISTFLTGEFEIPPLTMRYTTPGSAKPVTLATEKIRIEVRSVKPSEAGDIRDVKPPVDIPLNWKRIAGWATLAAGLLALAAGGFVWYRRRRRGRGLLPAQQAPARLAHETALEALARLEASDLLARGEVKTFYIEASEIIRRYVEARYEIAALEMTTDELLGSLREAAVPLEIHDLVRTFLERCDLVKFAKYQPPPEAHPETLALARAIVERTMVVMPLPPAVEAAPAAQDQAAAEIAAQEEVRP